MDLSTTHASTRSAPSTPARDSSAQLFAGGDEMGRKLAGIDWSQTPLGAVETWPQTHQLLDRETLPLAHGSSSPSTTATTTASDSQSDIAEPTDL